MCVKMKDEFENFHKLKYSIFLEKPPKKSLQKNGFQL